MTDAQQMPAIEPPAWDNIPPELAARQQWLLWRYEPNPKKPGGKPLKVPYYVSGGRRAGDQGSDRDRARLATLQVARRAFEASAARWTGIGFAFVPDDGLIGIDIDKAIDLETGEVAPRCLAIVEACASYTELSPSGTGVHIIVAGHTETAKDNGIGVEMFCGSQYFTFTGRPWAGSVPGVRAIDDKVLKRLHLTIQAGKDASRAAARPAPAPESREGETPAQLRARVEDALEAMQPDMGYDDWISIGWALKDVFGDFGFGLWDAWSARGGTYPGEAQLQSHWRSFRPSGKTPDQAVAVIFARARDAGWRAPRRQGAAGDEKRRKRKKSTLSAPPGDGGSGGGGDGPPPAVPPGGDDHDPPMDRDDVLALLIKRGKRPIDCRENVLYCLRNDPDLQGLVKQNLFTELHERSRDVPWGRPPGEWDEEDDLMLGEHLVRRYGLMVKAPGTLRAGVLMAAREHKFNPVLDLVRSQPWDGTERLEHWLADCLGVDDTPYTRLIGSCFIKGMVLRALRPGCKFDYMLILKGPQGAKKSTVFRTLAAPWFTDNAIRMGDKDSLMALQAIWIAESSELESLNKAETNAIKQFLSASEDLFRPPYGARMIKRPRHAVLGGTTNADVFLRDVTGDRRFWPLAVGEIDIEKLQAYRLQLFAEALVHLESQDAERRRVYPTPEQERDLIIPEQEQFKMTDVWEDVLYAYVNNENFPPAGSPYDQPSAKRDFFSTVELFGALKIQFDRIDGNKQMETRIGNAMRAIGFNRYRETKGARKRGYVRLKPDGKAEEGTPAPAQPDEPMEWPDSELPI